MRCFTKEGFDVGVNSHLEKALIVELILERVDVVEPTTSFKITWDSYYYIFWKTCSFE